MIKTTSHSTNPNCISALLPVSGTHKTVTAETVEVDVTPLEGVARLLDLPHLVLLDSSHRGGRMGRYSYLTADPFLTVRSRGRRVELNDGVRTHILDADPWDVLRQLLAVYHQQGIPGLPPFQGGLAGYFGYDLGRHVEKLPVRASDDLRLPEMSVGFYDWVLSYDHNARRGWLLTTGLPLGTTDAARARREQIVALLSPPSPGEHGPARDLPPIVRGLRFRSNVGRARYLDAVGKAKEYIARGDIYQVNLSQRLEADWQGDGWTLYRRLREVSPVPYGAYLALGDVTVLSASPERFLRMDEGMVETRPIKGTRPRGHTAERDRALAAELLASEKDRAENLMIVDLLRNDLGRVCRTGSVRVPRMFEPEAYANVWQLVSTITGELRPDLGAVDLLRSGFPGGSVTGCPKIRSMEIIEELEPVRRGIYCGSIGYVAFSGSLDTSLVIRTLVLTGGRLHLQVGGAVVADSDPMGEYEESLVKARAALDALGAVLEEW